MYVEPGIHYCLGHYWCDLASLLLESYGEVVGDQALRPHNDCLDIDPHDGVRNIGHLQNEAIANEAGW